MEKSKGHMLRTREAERLSRVYLEHIRFDDKAKRDFSKIPLPDTEEQLRDMHSLVENNRVSVAAIVRNGTRIGTFFYTILPLCGERTLWIVGIGSDSGELSEGTFLFPELGDEIRRIANIHDCRWVRADTSRPSVFALLTKLGFLPGMIQLYYHLKK